MKTKSKSWKERKEEIENMNIDMYLEIDVNQAAEMLLANRGLTTINGVSIEGTTNEYTIIELQEEINNSVRCKIELRLCHRNLPVARCSCEKGKDHVRCEHLVRALHAFAMLCRLGLVEKLTERSPHLWMPFKLQKT